MIAWGDTPNGNTDEVRFCKCGCGRDLDAGLSCDETLASACGGNISKALDLMVRATHHPVVAMTQFWDDEVSDDDLPDILIGITAIEAFASTVSEQLKTRAMARLLKLMSKDMG